MKKNTSNKEFELRHMSPEGQMGKGLPLVGDVRISLYDHDKMRERLACYFWFHTGFVENNYLCLTKVFFPVRNRIALLPCFRFLADLDELSGDAFSLGGSLGISCAALWHLFRLTQDQSCDPPQSLLRLVSPTVFLYRAKSTWLQRTSAAACFMMTSESRCFSPVQSLN